MLLAIISFDIASEVGRYTNVMIKTPLFSFPDFNEIEGENINAENHDCG